MTAIEFNNISKQYRLGLVSTRTLSNDLNRWWTMNILHKEDPYLKIGSVNDRSQKADSDYVWALKNIDFKVEQGDVLGIIGKNGAGKSTLLKLLSRVTTPTTGTIKARGRIASLLEVGTGFHPELTGRENIYMNGAILGMTKSEITRKLDEIIDFAGVERYIDTPTKRYSSGMTVRLGFAIAAHLDPEILVVDEVLAVGDAEFQKKAIGKMQNISKGEGRTVLFVSHNMGSVKSLCNKGMVLDNGMSVFSGLIEESINYYSEISLNYLTSSQPTHINFSNKIESFKYSFFNGQGEKIVDGCSFLMGDTLKININFICIETIPELSISFDIRNSQDELMTHITNEDDKYFVKKMNKGESQNINITTDKIFFVPGLYSIDIWIGSSHMEGCYKVKNAINFYIEQSEIVKRTRPLPKHMKTYIPSKWF